MNSDSNIQHSLKTSINQLLNYCQKNDWAGYDPFDGLNSRLFKIMPFFKNKFSRLLFTQVMKRLPFNLRPIFIVPKEHNPKGLALFCSSLLELSYLNLVDDDNLILELLNTLTNLRSPNQPYYCWGYNFDWQNRTILLPKYNPSIIVTTFAGNAYIDAYEKFGDTLYLKIAESAGHFLLKGLNIHKNDNEICFSYTPFDQSQIHNANLLGAAFLSRIYSITKEKEFLDYAFRAVRFSVNKQNGDGSWFYGEYKSQKWIDNFHTGYNLLGIKKFGIFTQNDEFQKSIQKGYTFYKENLFSDNLLPKYFHDKLFPIDVHSIAQSIITLAEFNDLDESAISHALEIYKWAINNFQGKEGDFFYQRKRFYTNKISYMRWSQAWMLYAMSILAKKLYIHL